MDKSNHSEDKVLTLTDTLHNIPQNILSIQSRDFLALTLDQQIDFLENAKMPKKSYSEIACITSIKMNSVEKYAMSCIVIGTEAGEVIVLDPQTFTQIHLVSDQTIFPLIHNLSI